MSNNTVNPMYADVDPGISYCNDYCRGSTTQVNCVVDYASATVQCHRACLDCKTPRNFCYCKYETGPGPSPATQAPGMSTKGTTHMATGGKDEDFFKSPFGIILFGLLGILLLLLLCCICCWLCCRKKRRVEEDEEYQSESMAYKPMAAAAVVAPTVGSQYVGHEYPKPEPPRRRHHHHRKRPVARPEPDEEDEEDEPEPPKKPAKKKKPVAKKPKPEPEEEEDEDEEECEPEPEECCEEEDPCDICGQVECICDCDNNFKNDEC